MELDGFPTFSHQEPLELSYCFLIGVKLLYNVVLVSAVQ